MIFSYLNKKDDRIWELAVYERYSGSSLSALSPLPPSPPPPLLSPPPPSILTDPCFFSPLSLSLHFWGLNSLEVSKPQLFKSHPNAEGENTREESRPESSFSNSKI